MVDVFGDVHTLLLLRACQVNAVIMVLVLRRISTANVRSTAKRNKAKFVVP